MNSQKERMLHSLRGGWRIGGCLVVALALGGWLGGTAFAQQQEANAADTPKPVTAVKGSAKTASAPASRRDTSKNAVTPGTGSSKTAPASVVENYPAASANQSSDPTAMPTGINAGNYHMGGSISMGWRYNDITGSQNNYDTFVNLHQGPRLFDFSFHAHSLNHNGSLFDTLSLTGFGFGGDPDNVVRMRMTKNRWYNFDGTYRRDKYFFDYNLLANPLNATGTVVPAGTVNFSPHALDLSRRMTNLNLTLLPESSIRFRLGYAHELLLGPSLSTNHVGTEALLYQDWRNTTDIYHAGVDFKVLPRTMFSYDQYVQHFKQDTSFVDALQVLPTVYFQSNGFIYQLGNGQLADMGISPANASCLLNGSTNPPTASPNCSAYTNYTRTGRPRATMPTERFSFQSTYFRKFTTTGQISYSSVDNIMTDYNELFTGYESRTRAVGSNVLGKTDAKRVLVNGNWNGIYQVTGKFRIMDTFAYNTWRIPGQFAFSNAYLFPTAGSGGNTNMLAPVAVFNSTNCPPPFTASTCPQHGGSSQADLALGTDYTYLGQRIATNTFQLGYDFTPRIGATLGYRYTNRNIYDYSSTYYSAETYYPGGSAGANAAFRGDCSSATAPNCTYDAATGVAVYTGFSADSDTQHNLQADINGNSALFGLWVRPANNLRASFNMELFSADQAYTRITPRLLRHYQINTTYTPVPWADITGAVDIVDSSDNVTYVENVEHNRSYSISSVLTPTSRFSFDLSYNYNKVYTQNFDCWIATAPTGYDFGACPQVLRSLADEPLPDGGLSIYQSISNFVSADMMVKPAKTLTFTLGYAGSFVRGTTSWMNPDSMLSINFLDPITPWGPLRFNYQMPYLKMEWNVYKGVSYTAAWNYYGYNSRGDNNPVGLIPLGTQDFNGNNMTMSAKYSF